MPCTLSAQCHWHITNQFRYLYSEPVTRVLTRLRLVPRPQHGEQRVVRTHLHIDPQPRSARSWADTFGNPVLEVEHARLITHLEVTAECCFALKASAGEDPPTLSPCGCPLEEPATARRLFLPPTLLVDRTHEFDTAAAELRRACATDQALAREAMRQVYQAMRYLPGSTGVETSASEAFAQRTGVCQDFAHVMLALCRAAGLPARYVSGHMEGEGQMHAWVEVFYAASPAGLPRWHALDPTHDRPASTGYVTIAVGRDYADVSPISGRCYGPEPGRLHSHQETRRCLSKRALPCASG